MKKKNQTKQEYFYKHKSYEWKSNKDLALIEFTITLELSKFLIKDLCRVFMKLELRFLYKYFIFSFPRNDIWIITNTNTIFISAKILD